VPGLFDWLDSINTGKTLELDEQSFKDYVPFQINNGMSQHLDTVLIANEMNKRPWLSKNMQYKFYCGAVIKKRRMGKWAKADAEEQTEDIDTVSAYYNVNRQVAATYLKIVKPEELEMMRKANFKGGAETRGRKK
jgi:hypothetical protein